jgi:hypothetical protein
VAAASRPAWPAEPPVLVELTGDDPTAPRALQDLDGVLTLEGDGSLLRVRVAAGASDALLAQALGLGLSVRRVAALEDAAEESPAGLAGEAP